MPVKWLLSSFARFAQTLSRPQRRDGQFGETQGDMGGRAACARGLHVGSVRRGRGRCGAVAAAPETRSDGPSPGRICPARPSLTTITLGFRWRRCGDASRLLTLPPIRFGTRNQKPDTYLRSIIAHRPPWRTHDALRTSAQQVREDRQLGPFPRTEDLRQTLELVAKICSTIVGRLSFIWPIGVKETIGYLAVRLGRSPHTVLQPVDQPKHQPTYPSVHSRAG